MSADIKASQSIEIEETSEQDKLMTQSKMKKEKKKKKKGPPKAPIYQLFRYNTCLDHFFMILGILGAIGAAMGMPLFALLFRDLLNQFNPNSNGEQLYIQI